MNLPTLYKKTSTGAIQEWSILVKKSDSDDFDVAYIVTLWGQVNGKTTSASDAISEGKNIGKSNETSPYQQACAEAKSQWEKKKKKGYVESFEDAKNGVLDALITGGAAVMLAQSYSKHAHKITYPCFVQPKLDGHRCVAIVSGGVCTLWSRTRKPILGVPHVQRFLEKMYPETDMVLDGELYNHEYKDRFEELTSFIRQEVPKPGHEVVEYWIYDTITPLTFSERQEKLDILRNVIEDRLADNPDEEIPVEIVQTWVCEDETELMDYFEVFLDQGYEGAMARNEDSPYVSKRSYDLQKIKEFDDAEFLIVNVESGRGKMSDKGVFVCKTDSGELFKAKMMGSLDDLVDLVDNPQNYIGRYVTVKYQGLTGKNSVPRFPVAVRMRDDI